MNSLTHFKKIRILPLRTLLSLGAIFALVTAAHAQNLYVSTQHDEAIFEYTPSGVQSTYASRLSFPRGLAFDSLGNLFAAETLAPADDVEVGKVLKFNLRNKATTLGSAARFFFEGLAIDIAGNAYVMGIDLNSPTFASTIFKFTPDGERIVFGSVPSGGSGVAFDSAGNLFAADADDQTIYKFAPDGTRTVFAGPSAFGDSAPSGLAFDSAGNLFVSTESDEPVGNDTILEFTPIGAESTFATGLSTPRGLAFDSSGNLFVVEHLHIPDGDILKFPPGGGPPTAFATGLGSPEFLTFGPPR
ncbi:MAG: hypothetical protein DME76_15540 [Verrucomicrobia bacterium]|nr:MAG: hypothetical protein DME76_15540 [Verrucomicrobiota bacterium]